jgi:hypothetical protein
MRTNAVLAATLAGLTSVLAVPRQGDASTISITAAVSDRGSDLFPRDGSFDQLFADSSVMQVTTPPSGDPGSEERVAIEFALAGIPIGSIIDAVTLRLTPQGNNANLGLSASESAEVHGYAGNGTIELADLMMINLVGMLAGAPPDGPVSTSLLATWLQGLVDGSSPFAGMMFKGVDGPAPVTMGFAGTFNGIPVASRPTLTVDYHASDEMGPVPEPATMILVASGMVATLGARRRRRQPPDVANPKRGGSEDF